MLSKLHPFTRAFVITIFIFVVVNLLFASLRSDCGLQGVLGWGCSDGIRYIGFPFLILESGGYAYRHEFRLTALILDVIVGVGLGLLAGLGYKRLVLGETKVDGDVQG